MLTAYEDCGLKIKDIPMEEIRVPLFPIENLDDAWRILAEARRQRPDVAWEIKGNGPYGVHGQLV